MPPFTMASRSVGGSGRATQLDGPTTSSTSSDAGTNAAGRDCAHAQVVGARRHAVHFEGGVGADRQARRDVARAGRRAGFEHVEARLGAVQRRAPLDAHDAAVREGVQVGGCAWTSGHAGARIEGHAAHRIDLLVVEIGQRLAAGQHAFEPRVERVHDAVPLRPPRQQIRTGAGGAREHRREARPRLSRPWCGRRRRGTRTGPSRSMACTARSGFGCQPVTVAGDVSASARDVRAAGAGDASANAPPA